MSHIENILVSRQDSAAEVLSLQWRVAKSYVPKVLNTISQVFPHYSLHDESHSETIINCIERILGSENLDCLSSTDLWMMLCAAYYHDLGMVVYSDDYSSVFESDDFVEYVSILQDDSSSPYYEYASVFDKNDKVLTFKSGIELNSTTYSAARYLIAEYLRKQHANRSKMSISEEISLNIPGCKIPKRLLNLIGRICELHTSSFKEVLSLPFEETGMGSDNCHPRFVACMLRLGDLLDLDNNRFSDVLLSTLPSIPSDSLFHKEKHLSMSHILIDHKSIELSSACNDMDVYEITNSWLELLSKEMDRQRAHWNIISPSENKLCLPCVGNIEVTLNDWDMIDGRSRPKFKIDSEKAIEMLQGTGLYKSPHQCLREILQNSVDATYLRIYQESLNNGSSIKTYSHFKELCKSKKIKVILEKEDVDQENVKWSVCVRDEGIGMSKEDLGFLLKTGSKNPEKDKMISRMPEFMKPSGTFGIGFQSVFLLTDMVKLKTHRLGKEETITAELHNPSKNKKGTALIKTSKDFCLFGTEISFSFVVKKIIDSYHLTSDEREASLAVFGHDFVTDDSMDIDAARILHEVRQFAAEALVTIEMDMCGQSISIGGQNKESIFSELSKNGNFEVTVHGKAENFQDLVFYRGQLVEKGSTNLLYLNAFVNILSGNAKQIVSLNRNELQSEYKSELKKCMIGVFTDYVIKNYATLSEKAKPEASMFLLTYDEENKKNHPDGVVNDWRKYRYDGYVKCNDCLGDILSKCRGKSVCIRQSNEYSIQEEGENVIINYPYDDVVHFLHNRLKLEYKYFGLKWINRHQYTLYSNTPCELIADMDGWLKDYCNSHSTARTLMPCMDKYNKLRLKEGAVIPWGTDCTSLFGFNVPQMICPYVKEVEPGLFCHAVGLKWNDGDGNLAQMTFDNRFDPTTTMDEIVNTLRIFRDDTEDIVRNIDKEIRTHRNGA